MSDLHPTPRSLLRRTKNFTPEGEMSEEELKAEGIGGFRWWSLTDIQGYEGPDLFSPRDLAALLPALLSAPPSPPLLLGL